MGSGVIGVADDLRRSLRGRVRARIESIMHHADLVTREEFETMAEIASRARAEQERLEARVAELTARLERLEKGPANKPAKPATARRPAARTTTRRRSTTNEATD